MQFTQNSEVTGSFHLQRTRRAVQTHPLHPSRSGYLTFLTGLINLACFSELLKCKKFMFSSFLYFLIRKICLYLSNL